MEEANKIGNSGVYHFLEEMKPAFDVNILESKIGVNKRDRIASWLRQDLELKVYVNFFKDTYKSKEVHRYVLFF